MAREDDRRHIAETSSPRVGTQASVRREAVPAVPSTFREHREAVYAAGAGFLFGIALFLPSLCGITDWTPVPF